MAGRLDEAAQLLHEDLVVHEAPGLPYGGEYHGPKGFFELLGKITSVLTIDQVETRLLEADDTVFSVSALGFISQVSDDRVDTDVVELFKVRDGLIVDLDIFYKDPGAITALMGRAKTGR
jgi:hypothetical protein